MLSLILLFLTTHQKAMIGAGCGGACQQELLEGKTQLLQLMHHIVPVIKMTFKSNVSILHFNSD